MNDSKPTMSTAQADAELNAFRDFLRENSPPLIKGGQGRSDWSATQDACIAAWLVIAWAAVAILAAWHWLI